MRLMTVIIKINASSKMTVTDANSITNAIMAFMAMNKDNQRSVRQVGSEPANCSFITAIKA